MNCPLCRADACDNLLKSPDGRYFQCCPVCELIYTEKAFLSEKSEKERYLEHNNGIEYPGYVAFLQRILTPALAHLEAGMHGLDYGCGPVPTLSILLERENMTCGNYDPLFFPALNREEEYDFIFATECFEHFFDPAKELKTLEHLLRPGGYLFVMTQMYTPENMSHFKDWYYANDPTHVVFYNEKTFEWIAEQFNLELLKADDRLIFLRKM